MHEYGVQEDHSVETELSWNRGHAWVLVFLLIRVASITRQDQGVLYCFARPASPRNEASQRNVGRMVESPVNLQQLLLQHLGSVAPLRSTITFFARQVWV